MVAVPRQNMGLALASIVPVSAVLGALLYLSARYGVWHPVGPTLYRIWWLAFLIALADVGLMLLRMGLAGFIGDTIDAIGGLI